MTDAEEIPFTAASDMAVGELPEAASYMAVGELPEAASYMAVGELTETASYMAVEVLQNAASDMAIESLQKAVPEAMEGLPEAAPFPIVNSSEPSAVRSTTISDGLSTAVSNSNPS